MLIPYRAIKNSVNIIRKFQTLAYHQIDKFQMEHQKTKRNWLKLIIKPWVNIYQVWYIGINFLRKLMSTYLQKILPIKMMLLYLIYSILNTTKLRMMSLVK